jgi:excisionase family DNA binding protein
MIHLRKEDPVRGNALIIARKRKSLSTIRVARMLEVSVSSVSKWIDDGSLVAGRTPGGHRRIEAEQLAAFLRRQNLPVPPDLEVAAPKVLIVDDEKPFTLWLAEEIRSRCPGVEVLAAHDGYSSGELVAMAKPRVIVLDLHMPGMDGFEVLRRIKAGGLLERCRVIAVTADASAANRTRILKMGASLCLAKPFDAALIADEINKAIDHRR